MRAGSVPQIPQLFEWSILMPLVRAQVVTIQSDWLHVLLKRRAQSVAFIRSTAGAEKSTPLPPHVRPVLLPDAPSPSIRASVGSNSRSMSSRRAALMVVCHWLGPERVSNR